MRCDFQNLDIAGFSILRFVGAGQAERESYFIGSRAKLLKSQNVVWLLLLSVSCWAVVWRFTQSFVTAWIALVLTNAPLVFQEVGGYMIDSLYTEALAAALFAPARYPALTAHAAHCEALAPFQEIVQPLAPPSGD